MDFEELPWPVKIDILKKEIESLKAEIAADDRNVNALMDQVHELSKEKESLKAQLQEARGFLKHFEKADGSAYQAIKAQLDRYTRIAECGMRYGDDLDNIERMVELEAQLADLLKGPLSNEETPTDREWTDVEWARNQWWLHMRAAQGFEAQLAECRDKALEEAALMGKRAVLDEEDLTPLEYIADHVVDYIRSLKG